MWILRYCVPGTLFREGWFFWSLKLAQTMVERQSNKKEQELEAVFRKLRRTFRAATLRELNMDELFLTNLDL